MAFLRGGVGARVGDGDVSEERMGGLEGGRVGGG